VSYIQSFESDTTTTPVFCMLWTLKQRTGRWLPHANITSARENSGCLPNAGEVQHRTTWMFRLDSEDTVNRVLDSDPNAPILAKAARMTKKKSL
jgi:hypothetical protein